MHCLGLLGGSVTLYFLQNLKVAVERGEDVLGCPAPCSKGCLFLLQFPEMLEVCLLSRCCRAKDSCVPLPVIVVPEVPL